MHSVKSDVTCCSLPLARHSVIDLIRPFWVHFCRYDSSSMSLLLHVLQMRNLNKAIVRDGYKV